MQLSFVRRNLIMALQIKSEYDILKTISHQDYFQFQSVPYVPGLAGIMPSFSTTFLLLLLTPPYVITSYDVSSFIQFSPFGSVKALRNEYLFVFYVS